MVRGEKIYKPILRDKDNLLKFIESEDRFRGVSQVEIIEEAKDENTFSAS